MTEFFGRLGTWWGDFLLAHPLATGLWIFGFFIGWTFQHAVKLYYPKFEERPAWARWVVVVADAFTLDLTTALNNLFKRFVAK